MPRIYLTREELMKSKGLGASDVAAVLHEDPWKSAYELWQIKTGRRPKPPQTAAMKFGAEMEEAAFQAYLRDSGYHAAKFRQQAIARHPQLEFLRGIADGWDEAHGVGAEIKVPSSRHLLDHVARGVVPGHYLLQLAAMMAIFGVDTWDFYVYDAEKKTGELILVGLDDEFRPGQNLRSFWESAIPHLSDFWQRVQSNIWAADGTPAAPDPEAWTRAIELRNLAAAMIRDGEERKDSADAEIKRLMGNSLVGQAAGWKAQLQYHPATQGVVVQVAAEYLAHILEMLAPLASAPGVRSVKSQNKADYYALNVDEVKEL